jgi:hypothetical protein
MKLGTTARKIELTDNDIIKILKEETLPKISNYFPRRLDVVIIPAKHEITSIPNKSTFIIPVEETIINVIEVIMPTGMGDLASIASQGSFIAFEDVVSDLVFHPNFEPPNKFTVYPNVGSTISYFTIGINVIHQNFQTIKTGIFEKVKKVALGDVSEAILAMRNQFQAINSEYGEINLNLDYLEKLIQEKDEMMNMFEDKYGLVAARKKVYFI